MTPLLIIPIDGKPWALAVDRRTRLGRNEDCTLQLQSHLVSRHHAQLIWDGVRAWVEDLGSRNGTFVNGQRVNAPTILHDRDELRLADVTLQFRLSRHARPGVDPHYGTGRERGMIVFHCPSCAHRIGADAAMAHFLRTCPNCQDPLIVLPPRQAASMPRAGAAPRDDSAWEAKPASGSPLRGEAAPVAVAAPPKSMDAAHAEPLGQLHGRAASFLAETHAAPHLEQAPVEAGPIESRLEATVGVTATEVPERTLCHPAQEVAQDQAASRVVFERAAPPPVRTSTEPSFDSRRADHNGPSNTEAPAATAPSARNDSHAGEVSTARGVVHAPVQRETIEQRVGIARAPQVAPSPDRSEPTHHMAWHHAPSPTEAPTPIHTTQPRGLADDVSESPWVTATERPGIRMDQDPSAAPLSADTRPSAVDTTAERPHLEERDWFEARIDTP